MDDATPGPQRMRYSFESRCRAVAAMVAGLSPGVAAQAVGASRATGLVFKDTKTHRSTRPIALPPFLVAVLQDQRAAVLRDQRAAIRERRQAAGSA